MIIVKLYEAFEVVVTRNSLIMLVITNETNSTLKRVHVLQI